MKTSLFDYQLPKKFIAQSPAVPRDHSRLMVIDRKYRTVKHRKFYNIVNFLSKNDVLVLNKTKVFPARLFVKKVNGGKVEILFIEEVKPGVWSALTHPGLRVGTQVAIDNKLFACVGHKGTTALIQTHLTKQQLMKILLKRGHTPLPPYIKSKDKEGNLRKKYQTIYAKSVGSVAAPTAGFHFTNRLLKKIKQKGVKIEYVTLHVGLGTFLPIKTKKLENHPMHSEEYFVDRNTIKRLNKAKGEGKRIIAVGTTTTRVLESLVNKNSKLKTGNLIGTTKLFIYPPCKFNFIDALITNFHLPTSTLLALVSAFVSFPNTEEKFESFNKSLIGKAYREAIKKKYRFYSFGDACFII